MKRTEARSVGEIIGEIIDSGPDARPEYDRQQASWLWSQLLGPSITRVTTRRYVEGDTLHVYISSAAVKSELAFMLDPLIKRINDTIGRPVIRKISLH